MAQWRRCTNAVALRFGRNYYLLTIAVAFTLWLCDQHFCVHLHGLPGMSQTAAVTGRSVRAVSTAVPTGRLGSPPGCRVCASGLGLRPPGGPVLGPIFPTPAFGLTDLPGGVHNPQFHAWWHGIMGFHCYYGATFMIYQRLVYLGRKPRLRYLLGVLVYVVPGPA